MYYKSQNRSSEGLRNIKKKVRVDRFTKTKYNPTKVAPGDLRRWRPADFAVKSSVTPLNHFQNIQLTSEERLNRRDDFEFAT